MTHGIGSRQFREAGGVEDWRMHFDGAVAYFRADSFGTAVALAEAIGRAAVTAGVVPDVDLRADGVTVRIHWIGIDDGLPAGAVELARLVSAAARDLGAPPDPTVPQSLLVSIDALVGADVLPFWRAVLGYDAWGEEDLVDPRRRGPALWFQPQDAPRPQRNRIHLDVMVAPEVAEARVAAALGAGGRLVCDAHAPRWWTLADVEGNEADLTSWTGRD